MPSITVTEPRPPLAERPQPGRPFQVALFLVAGAAAGALAAAGRRWETPGADGGVGTLRPLAWAVAAVWLVVVLAAPSVGNWATTTRQWWRRGLYAVGVATIVVVAVAAGRLGAALADDAHGVVSMRTTWAAWLAPAALVALVALAGRLVPRRPARLAVAAGALAALVGAGVGAAAFGPPDRVADGDIVRGFRSRPGERIGPANIVGRAGVPTALVAVDGGLLLSTGGELLAVDDAGRWYPYLTAEQMAPEGYGGHVAAAADRDRFDLVRGLFPRGDDLVVVGPEGLFTLPDRRGDRGRMVVALAEGRTTGSLDAFRTAGVPLVTEGTAILGAGPDGRGGLLVATELGVSRVAADGTVTYLPGTRRAFDADPEEARRVYNVVVQGRADGSGLLVVGCTWFDMAPNGDVTVANGVRARRNECTGLSPAAVGLDGRGEVALVDPVTEDWYAPGLPEGSLTPVIPAGVGMVVAEGDHVVAVLGDGRLLRIAERTPTTPRT